MTDTIVVKVEGEEGEPEVVATAEAVTETALEGAVAIVEVAKDLGVLLAQGDDDLLIEIVTRIAALETAADRIFQLVESVFETVKSLGALQVAEVIVESTPAELAEVETTATLIEEVAPTPEEVAPAVTPEIRQGKKRTTWID